MSRTSWFLTLVMVAVLGVLTVYRTSEALARRAEAAEDVVRAAPVVEVAPVAKRRIRATATVSGTLKPVNEVDVVADVPGRIVSISAEIGDKVAKGQVLARLDTDDLAISVRQARAAWEAAKAGRDAGSRELSSSEQLFAANGISEVAIAGLRGRATVASAQVEQAEAALAMAQARLADATIRSPITGVVSDRSTGEGRTINPGAPLFHVVDVSTLEMEAGLDEAVVATVSPGTSVDILHRGETLVGKVRVVSPALDARTRKAKVVVSVVNEALIANASVEARVVVGDRDVISVPTEALLYRDGVAQVVTVVGGKTVRATVQPGLSDGTWTEVSGLAEGVDVVVRGGAAYAEGATVTAQPVTL